MAWEYSEKTTKMFMDAVSGKPGTHLGEIENPDGIGEHGSISCGDALRFTFRTEKHPTDPLLDVITETRYLTFGCTSAIAASEALCCMIEGKRLTPIDSLKISNKDIVDFLDGLPEQKIHCSVMGAEALEAAVYNWAQKRGVDLHALGVDMHTEEQAEGRIVCKCFTISEPYLKRKIQELNLHTIDEITGAIKAGGACMSCHHSPGGLQDILNSVWGTQNSVTNLNIIDTTGLYKPQSTPPDADKLSPFQFAKKIEKMLNEKIRPVIHRDGGEIELVDVKDNIVYVELKGSCAGCAGAGQTLRFLVERTLKEQVDERIKVIQL